MGYCCCPLKSTVSTFLSGRLHFALLVVVLHEPGPDRRQDDFLETGRTQLHPVLPNCRAGHAEKPEARSEGRGGQEGRRHDQDEEVDRRQTRGCQRLRRLCEPSAKSVRLTHREPGPSDSPRWLWRHSGGGRSDVDCEVVILNIRASCKYTY